MRSSRRRLPVLLGAVAALAACAAGAAEVRILRLEQAGRLVWTNDFALEGIYFILDAPALGGGWETNASGIQPAGAVVTQAVSVTASQRFFRVKAGETVGTPADASLGQALDFPTNWICGTYPWFLTNSPLRPGGDGDVAQSGAIPAGEETWFGAYFNGPVDLSFWWKVSCQTNPNSDYVAFYVDGLEKKRIFGSVDWTNLVRGITPGRHLAVWKYVKDASVVGGQDAAWVDTVTNIPRSVMILEGESLNRQTDEDVPLTIELHAYVASGPAQWSIYDQADHGVASTNAGTSTNRFVTYTPAADWNGSDSFVVQVAAGAESDRITVNVTVNPVNDAPVIIESSPVHVIIDEDENPVAFSLTLHAFDPDTAGANLLWTPVAPAPASGSASLATGTGTSQGVLYDPAANWNTHGGSYLAPGGTPSLANRTNITFGVRVEESGTGQGETVIVEVEIRPCNDAPTNATPPSIIGAAKVAKVLTAVPGVFRDNVDVTGTPTQYLARAVQWQRSVTGSGGWANLAGATAATYTLQGDDYAMYVRVVETVQDKGEGLPSPQSCSAASGALGPVGMPDPGDLPQGLSFVPGGSAVLGGLGGDAPLRTNTLSAVYMDTYEVTKGLWDQVRAWGLTNGYTDIAAGQAGTSHNKTNGSEVAMTLTHPVVYVTWYDCVKWCNARSEMGGLTPVYCTDPGLVNVYRTGATPLLSENVRWTASGYRLPTEAEWEHAARGGLAQKLYPWGDTIGGNNANYYSSGDAFESQGGNVQGTTPAGYYNGTQQPPGPDMKNGYGLYDMAGNVREWCWDRYTATPTNGAVNPKGPDTGTQRMAHGGAWVLFTPPYTTQLRCADRSQKYLPGNSYNATGFRAVRRP